MTDQYKKRLKKFSEQLPPAKDEYYESQERRLDTIIGDSATTWAQINRAKTEYDTVDHGTESFYVWLRETYGIKLKFTPDGNLQLENEIVDPQKFTIFLLKFQE